MKAKIAVASRPGRLSGMTMRRKRRTGPRHRSAPPLPARAGILAKKPRNIHVENGIANAL